MTAAPKDGAFDASIAGLAAAPSIHAEQGSVAAGSVSQSLIQVFNQAVPLPSDDTARALEAAYLHRLCNDCGRLDWLASVGLEDGQAAEVTLGAVYTALRTNRSADAGRLQQEPRPDASERRLAALAVLNAEQHLVLVGDPGSGKSAFADFAALCLAGERLAAGPICEGTVQPGPCLHDLTEPLPDDGGQPADDAPRQPWRHGALLPVRMVLRDFAASGHFPGAGERGDAGALLAFIAADLTAKGLGGFLPLLGQHLLGQSQPGGGALLILDGLDEVSQAGARRVRLVECIRGLADSLPGCRILVTCRPYAYARPEWRIPGFAEAGLAPFDEGQIRCFVGRWYATRIEYGLERRRERADALGREVLARPALCELAERPLLLTLTAYLHSKGQDLPERRAALYGRLLELLVERWERARFRTSDAAAARRLEQHSLAEFLDVGQDEVRRVLERRAFSAHASQQDVQGTADIPACELTHDLLCIAQRRIAPSTGTGSDCGFEDRSERRPIDALALSEYLRDRVGILHQRCGNDERDAVYSFPHRSFQEFLAAVYLSRDEAALYDRFPESGCDDWPELAAWLARTDPDRWREVVLLAAGHHANSAQAWQLADALYPEAEFEPEALVTAEDAWGLRLAAEVLAESLPKEKLKRRNERTRERVRGDLPRLLGGCALPAIERITAGLHLAQLGDSRSAAIALDAMPFCRVPAGSVFLGATDEQAFDDEKTGAGPHRMDYGYWIARWPMTVAQWQAYLDAAGRQPEDLRALRGPANTPVVYVSWHEAMACADWLTEHWQGGGLLPAGWRVNLPSEPEWEQAAKGGERIPAADAALIGPLVEIGKDIERDPSLVANTAPRRRYPWGDPPDSERMNYQMDIGRVSPVGCYADGASPYGCEELSGNVLEWTRSRFDAYPYPEDAAGRSDRENLSSAGRVLRGGAFYLHPQVRAVLVSLRRLSRPPPLLRRVAPVSVPIDSPLISGPSVL